MSGFMKDGFTWVAKAVDADGNLLREMVIQNIIPQVGKDLFAGLLLGTTPEISNWYVGIYEGNYLPVNSTTAADLPVNAAETTAYTQTTRQPWSAAYDGVSLLTNQANLASFTLNAAKEIRGGFIVSNAAKGSNTGTILSMVLFPTPYDLPSGAILTLEAYVAVA